jgi:hypothetical protein
VPGWADIDISTRQNWKGRNDAEAQDPRPLQLMRTLWLPKLSRL